MIHFSCTGEKYEILQSAGLNHRQFSKLAWLHVTQIRRPERLLVGSDIVPLQSVMNEKCLASLNGNVEFQERMQVARSSVELSIGDTPLYDGIDEFLVVGNGLHRSVPLGKLIDKHPFVVRFGEGGMPEKLASNREFVGERTDLYCLNGWIRHPADHLIGKRVLFTRPFESAVNLSHGLFVSRENRDHIARFTSNICHISRLTFHRFIQEFQYGNPTSGLIFVYYVVRVLGKKVKLVNFVFEGGLPSFHSVSSKVSNNRLGSHNVDREREILASIVDRACFLG